MSAPSDSAGTTDIEPGNSSRRAADDLVGNLKKKSKRNREENKAQPVQVSSDENPRCFARRAAERQIGNFMQSFLAHPTFSAAPKQCIEKANLLLKKMKQGQQKLSDFDDVETLWGYSKQKFTVRAMSCYDALEVACQYPELAAVLYGVESVASLGGGPGNDVGGFMMWKQTVCPDGGTDLLEATCRLSDSAQQDVQVSADGTVNIRYPTSEWMVQEGDRLFCRPCRAAKQPSRWGSRGYDRCKGNLQHVAMLHLFSGEHRQSLNQDAWRDRIRLGVWDYVGGWKSIVDHAGSILGASMEFGPCDINEPLSAPCNLSFSATIPTVQLFLFSYILHESRSWQDFFRDLYAKAQPKSVFLFKDCVDWQEKVLLSLYPEWKEGADYRWLLPLDSCLIVIKNIQHE